MQLRILGLQGTTSLDAVKAATRNLTLEQVKAALSTTNLEKEQIKEILSLHGVADAELENVAATIMNTTATGTATTATGLFTGATISLKTALKGLWATMMANPITAVITIVTTLISVISLFKSNIEDTGESISETINEAAQKSKEQADASKEELDSLTELIAKYKELAKSDTQDASTRQEIAEIQSEIVSLTGAQADEIDLVNGKLEEQLGILSKLRGQSFKSTEFNFEKAYMASRAVPLNLNDSISNFMLMGKEAGQSPDIANYLSSISASQNYSERAEHILAAINSFKQNPNYDYLNSPTWNYLTDYYNALYGDDGYLTNQLGIAEDLLDVLLQGYGVSDDSIKTSNDYAILRENIIASILDNSTIKQIIEDGLLNASDIETYIDNYLAGVSGLESYYNDWSASSNLQGVKDAFAAKTNANNYISDSFNILANNGGDFSDTKENVRFEVDEFNSWLDSLSTEDKELVYKISCDADTSDFTFEDWQYALNNFIEFLEPSTEEIKSKLSTITTQYNTFVGGIEKATEVLSSQQSGVSLSVEDFNSEELKDYTSALEYQNGVLQLNSEKVYGIIEAKSEEQIAINDTNKALAQSRYLKNAAEIEGYRKELKESTDLTDEQRDSIQNNIDALLEENSTIKSTCDSYDLMSASLKEATGAYQKWLDAQSGSDYGDMFDDALEAYQRIVDTYNKDSDIYGDFGSKKFEAAVELWLPDDIDSDDTEAIKSYMKKVKSYLTFDSDGDVDGMNINKFCDDAVKAGLMVFDEASDSYYIAGSKTMEDFANGLNLSLPMIQAFFDELQLKGGEFSWADEADKTIGDLAVSATEAAEILRGLDGNEEFEIRLDVSKVDDEAEKIQILNSTIDEMNDIKAKPNVDASEIEYANEIIRYCITQQQQLSAPIVMAVDTSSLSDNQAEAIGYLQDFERACNNLELTEALGLDTTEAQLKVDELRASIASSDNQYLVALDLDTTSAETLRSDINAITGNQLNVTLGINEDAIIGYTAIQKESTVKYKIDTSAVDAYNPKNLIRVVTYHIKTVGSVSGTSGSSSSSSSKKSGFVKLNGTAHVNGTAYANGNWGAAQGGKTLTGELGRKFCDLI